MRILEDLDTVPPSERNIIVGALLTMREVLVQIRNETDCNLLDRIEKFDNLIEIFHNNNINIIVERYKE